MASRRPYDTQRGLPCPAGGPYSYCVCVPARDEESRLGRLLSALADQDVAGVIPVVICLNNTTDASALVIARSQRAHAGRLAITVDEHVFPSGLAHAGSARRRAMDVGLALVGPLECGVLLTTDADTRPPDTWISENLRAIDRGAHIVGGRLIVDGDEPLAEPVKVARALWDRYWHAVRRIEDEIDPRPHDPPPRHGDHTGASLALSTAIYRAAGGVPPIALGEDRALVEAALIAGGRLVHPMSVWTRVSPRLDGRAAGGMAQAMVALGEAAETGRALMAPSLEHWRRRAAWRRGLRRGTDADALIARIEPRLPPMPHDTQLAKMRLMP